MMESSFVTLPHCRIKALNPSINHLATMEESQKNKLSKWLESLQQESWQLELIISGFAIFLRLSMIDPLQQLSLKVHLMSLGMPNTSV